MYTANSETTCWSADGQRLYRAAPSYIVTAIGQGPSRAVAPHRSWTPLLVDIPGASFHLQICEVARIVTSMNGVWLQLNRRADIMLILPTWIDKSISNGIGIARRFDRSQLWPFKSKLWWDIQPNTVVRDQRRFWTNCSELQSKIVG